MEAICMNCVMDTTDSKITFDDLGVCDHCRDFKKNVYSVWQKNVNNPQNFIQLIEKIKREGEGKEFDSILGMSGGVDSSYMLHLMTKELGLRPLVFHVDGGWNTELAVNNIQLMVEKLGVDLYTEVINWEEMKALQLAFFKSGVPHIDIPQDHAFIATLYNFAFKNKIKYIFNGGNISTECVRNPLEFLYYGTDMLQLNDIIRKFCKIPLQTFPFSSIWRHKIYLRYIKRIQVIRPLNFMNYNKADAVKFLSSEYGWAPYPQKHFESRFTRFYEGFWLPARFNFDTRKVQYSSLILTGQMSREEALDLLKLNNYSDDDQRDDFRFVATKLSISENELKEYLEMPRKFYWNYRNQTVLFNLGARFIKLLGLEMSIKR
jgi:N-acetyl sugar amidotransferase